MEVLFLEFENFHEYINKFSSHFNLKKCIQVLRIQIFLKGTWGKNCLSDISKTNLRFISFISHEQS